MPRWVALLVFLLAECPLPAQIQAPGVPGIPMPRLGKKKKTPAAAAQPTVNVSGVLRSLDAKQLVLEAQDTRILTLTRTEGTKFYKNSAEAQPGDFKPGDHVFVDATKDDQGFLFAAAVTWQKEGTSVERAGASKPVQPSVRKPSGEEDGPPVLRRADSPAQATPKDEVAPAVAEPEPERPQIRDAQPPVRVGADDPGPPVLRHGAPARRATIEPPTTIEPPAGTAPVEIAAAASAPAALAPEPPKADAVVEKARSAARAFDEKLPNYICEQFTTRYQSVTRPVDWKSIDIVSAEVIYENDRERYRDVKINGKKTVKSMEESGGTWSTGEFGSVLADLFSGSTGAEFRRRKTDTIAGVAAVVYDFSVERERSHWTIHAPSQLVKPAYRGAVWIDPRSGRVLRIETQALRLPEEFPFDTIESAVDYQYIRLGGPGEFLLPVHAEILSCERGSRNCTRNAIDFRNYHHYMGESKITFEP